MDTKKLVGLIISLFVLIGMTFSIYFFFESRYALANDLKLVELRLDSKVEGDKYFKLQERLWQLQDRQEVKPSTDNAREIRELKDQLEMQSEVIKQIQKGIEERR